MRKIIHSISCFLLCEVICLSGAEPLAGDNVEVASPGEFPFIASLQKKTHHDQRDVHICTGVLITLKHVITCEHCITSLQPRHVHVAIGIVDIEAPTVKHDVKWWITYDQWSESPKLPSAVNDIVIIILLKAVSQNGVAPLGLTQLNISQLYETKAVTAGWGSADDNKIARHLRKAAVDILSPRDCNKRLFLASNTVFQSNRPDQFCSAATPFALVTAGDSGGPIIAFDNTLVGMNFGPCPRASLCWPGLSNESLNQYKVNVHLSIEYYTPFINAIANIQPSAIQLDK